MRCWRPMPPVLPARPAGATAGRAGRGRAFEGSGAEGSRVRFAAWRTGSTGPSKKAVFVIAAHRQQHRRVVAPLTFACAASQSCHRHRCRQCAAGRVGRRRLLQPGGAPRPRAADARARRSSAAPRPELLLCTVPRVLVTWQREQGEARLLAPSSTCWRRFTSWPGAMTCIVCRSAYR